MNQYWWTQEFRVVLFCKWFSGCSFFACDYSIRRSYWCAYLNTSRVEPNFPSKSKALNHRLSDMITDSVNLIIHRLHDITRNQIVSYFLSIIVQWSNIVRQSSSSSTLLTREHADVSIIKKKIHFTFTDKSTRSVLLIVPLNFYHDPFLEITVSYHSNRQKKNAMKRQAAIKHTAFRLFFVVIIRCSHSHTEWNRVEEPQSFLSSRATNASNLPIVISITNVVCVCIYEPNVQYMVHIYYIIVVKRENRGWIKWTISNFSWCWMSDEHREWQIINGYEKRHNIESTQPLKIHTMAQHQCPLVPECFCKD